MPPPKRVPTDLHRVLGDALVLYTGLFQDVSITAEFAPDAPPVRVDPEQIRRIVINLVDNAIEAMARKGRIVVEVQHAAADRVARIVVADNGPGIPASELPELRLDAGQMKRLVINLLTTPSRRRRSVERW